MERYAILKNNVVINILISRDAFAKKIGAVILPNGFGMGDIYKNGQWKHKQ